MLDGVFARRRSGPAGPGPRLDRVVEEMAHGVGRALWRDIGRAAERAARPAGRCTTSPGPARRWRRAGPAFGLRIVAESEGAFALAALLGAMQTEAFAAEAGPFFEMLQSVDLVAPPLNAAEYAALAMLSERRLGTGSGRTGAFGSTCRTRADEKRLAVPPYGRLVLRAGAAGLPGRGETEAAGGGDRVDGARAPQDRGRVATWDAWSDAPRTELVPIGWPPGGAPSGQAPITQIQLIYRSDVSGRLKSVLRRNPARTAPGSEETDDGKRPMARAVTSKGTPKGTPKITVDELGRKLSDLSIPEEELARYFEVDEATSSPTRPGAEAQPRYRPGPAGVGPRGPRPVRAAAQQRQLRRKLRREARFQQIVNSGKYKGPLIAAEGDSWFQFPFILKDVIDWVFEDFAVYLPLRGRRHARQHGAHGRVPRRADAHRRAGAAALGRGQRHGGRRQHRRAPAAVRPEPDARRSTFCRRSAACWTAPSPTSRRSCASVGRAFPSAAVICHGYDYTVPNDGKWLGQPMAQPRDRQQGAAEGDRARDGRPAQHPADDPREPVAADFLRELPRGGRRRALARRAASDQRRLRRRGQAIRRGDPAADPQPRGAADAAACPRPPRRLRARRRAKLPTRPEAAKAKGVSLHVGLNTVDPAQYEGWDGAAHRLRVRRRGHGGAGARRSATSPR